LGHTEELAVNKPVPDRKPDVGKRPQDNGHVIPVVGTEQSGHVLSDKYSAWSNILVCDSCKVIKQTTPLTGQTLTLTGNA
jgi:hypothetical protein